MKKRNKNLSKLREVVDKLANDIELDIKNRDHQLITNLKLCECWECHIEPDWFLVYRKNKSDLILLLIETDSHSDLFK